MNLFHHFHHVGVNDEPFYQQRRPGRHGTHGNGGERPGAQRAGRGGCLAAEDRKSAGHRRDPDAADGIGAGVSRRRRAGPSTAAAEQACAGDSPLRLFAGGDGMAIDAANAVRRPRLAGPAAGHRPRRPGAGRHLPHGSGGASGVGRGVQADDGGDYRGRSSCRFAGANLCCSGDKGSLFRAGVAGRPGVAGGIDGAGCGAGWGLRNG